MQAIRSEWFKWIQTIRISWVNLLTYKINFFFLVIGPSIVFFIVRYNVWSAIYRIDPDMTIQGYEKAQMLKYQLWVLIVAMMGQAQTSINLANDIRLGKVSTYLVYPFDFWKFHASAFIALQGIQLLMTFVMLMTALALGLVSIADLSSFLAGAAVTFSVGFVWFSIQFLLGIMAFWLEQTWVLRAIFGTLVQFLSGAFLPLEIFPGWLQGILKWTPFPYLTYAPAKIFMGEYNHSAFHVLGILFVWMIIIVLVCKVTWNRGLKLYTASGM